MLEKAQALPADELVIDLEDSVAPDAKAQARAAVGAAVRDGEWGGRGVAVRINGPESPHCHRDVIEVVAAAGEALTSLVVPKVRAAGDLDFVDRLLGMVEAESGRTRQLALQALIETATGLARIHEIAHASPRLEALIVGYADLAASLGRPPGAGAHERLTGDRLGGHAAGEARWGWVQEAVLVAARDAGLQAIDGPWLEIADVEGFRASARGSRSLGYDGKWALHPDQLEFLNELFAPTEEEISRAEAILEALERSEATQGAGALLLDGEMVDEASRKLARRIVTSAEAAARRR
jgi:citrate lyase subunit beta / citryl-CoA lyase